MHDDRLQKEVDTALPPFVNHFKSFKMHIFDKIICVKNIFVRHLDFITDLIKF